VCASVSVQILEKAEEKSVVKVLAFIEITWELCKGAEKQLPLQSFYYCEEQVWDFSCLAVWQIVIYCSHPSDGVVILASILFILSNNCITSIFGLLILDVVLRA